MATTEEKLNQYRKIIAEHEAEQQKHALGSELWRKQEDQLRIYRNLEKNERRALGWPVCRDPLCYRQNPLPTKPKPSMEPDDWACEHHGGRRDYC